MLSGALFSASGAFAAIEIFDQSGLESIGVDTPLDGDYILRNSIDLSNLPVGATYIEGTFSGTFNGNSHTIRNLSKPLFNEINGGLIDDKAEVKNLTLRTSEGGVEGSGVLANEILSHTLIENVVAVGKLINSELNNVGGLAGKVGEGFNTGTEIKDVAVIVRIEGKDNVGGLVGLLGGGGKISTSFSSETVLGEVNVGGLVGLNYGDVSDSQALGSVTGIENVGGAVGNFANLRELSNLYSAGPVSGNANIGGLIGKLEHGKIVNSYATGTSNGNLKVGGFVGFIDGAEITNSFSTGNAGGDIFNVGRFVGFENRATLSDSFGSGTLFKKNPDETVEIEVYDGDATPGILEVVNATTLDPTIGNKYFIDSCINSTRPYLLNKTTWYTNSCVTGDTNSSGRDPIDRETLEVKELRTLEMIERVIGFKRGTLIPKSAAISFVNPREQIDLSQVKAVEISSTANVKVKTKTDEALQISLKSESKEPVELWVKFPDGKWLLAGVITFNKDGKAVLPPLQFKSAGYFTLALNKPTAGSAKGSEPLNQSGSLLVEVI